MPNYVYTCICKNEVPVTEPMEPEHEHFCGVCSGKMWRKPQPFRVNWNGLPPSAGEFAPEIQQHLNNVDQIRAETDEYYAQRDQHKKD